MKQYFTGFFTASCLTISTFLFIGANTANENLGDITVDSITLNGEFGGTIIMGGGILFSNKDNQQSLLIGSGDAGGGSIVLLSLIHI